MVRPHSRSVVFGFCKLLALVVVTCGGSGCVIRPMKIDGRAMEPFLKHGDRVLVSRDITGLKRGDVVVHYPKDQSRFFVHRIVGLPGEVLEIRDGQVFVDGNHLEEPYVDPAGRATTTGAGREKIPAGSYYLMGDNRGFSGGARPWEAVPKEDIYGRVVGTYWNAGS